MILTMPIIEDALSDFELTTNIINVAKIFNGIRLGKTQQDDSYVMVYAENNFVYCVNGIDSIIIKNSTLENVYNTIENYIEKFESWEKKLFQTIYQEGSLQVLVDLSKPIFMNPIFIVDELDYVCARTSHELGMVNEEWDFIITNGRMPFEKVSAIYLNDEFNGNLEQLSQENYPFIFSPPGMYHRGINFRIPSPLHENKYLGTFIIIENETPITVGMLHISRILADAICEWLSNHKNNHVLKTSDYIFTQLLEGQEIIIKEFNTQRLLAGYGESDFILAVIASQNKKYLKHIINYVESSIEGARCFEYKDDLLVICSLNLGMKNIGDIFQSICSYNKVRIGISYRFKELIALRSSYKQAKTALLCKKDQIVEMDTESAMEYFISEIERILHGTDMCHPALGELEQYDKKHGTHYFETLQIYLQNERSLVETAKALNVHRNSLIYRIERIKKIIGEELDDENVRDYILFSYRIKKGSIVNR